MWAIFMLTKNKNNYGDEEEWMTPAASAPRARERVQPFWVVLSHRGVKWCNYMDVWRQGHGLHLTISITMENQETFESTQEDQQA